MNDTDIQKIDIPAREKSSGKIFGAISRGPLVDRVDFAVVS